MKSEGVLFRRTVNNCFLPRYLLNYLLRAAFELRAGFVLDASLEGLFQFMLLRHLLLIC